MFAHLDRMAHGWKARQSAATGGVLADFGEDPWILLECVPNYVNVVASFNAAYAGMTRSFAGLLRTLGRTEAAAIADAEADTLAQAVTGMSLPHGRWQIRHPATTESIGHCLDFGLVAAISAGPGSGERGRAPLPVRLPRDLHGYGPQSAEAVLIPNGRSLQRPPGCPWPEPGRS